MNERTAMGPVVMNGAAVLVFVVFFSYFGLGAFKVLWGWDATRHIAAVQSYIDSPFRPLHECLPLRGESVVMTPYSFLVGVFGRLLSLSAYQAMQAAAIINLTLYLTGVFLFFRAWSRTAQPLLAAALFLFISSTVRESFFWSSDTSAVTLPLILPYPSFAAWGVLFVSLALARRFLDTGRRRLFAVFVPLLIVIIPSHPLTAAWLLMLLGLMALHRLARGDRQRAGLLMLGLAGAVLMALLWPHLKLWSLLQMTGVAEKNPFGRRAFSAFGMIYILSVPAAVYFLEKREHAAVVIGWLATGLVFLSCRLLQIDFGHRLALFMALFPQILVTEFIVRLLGRVDGKSRAVGLIALSASLVGGFHALGDWFDKPNVGLRTPSELLMAPDSNEQHYASLGRLPELLGPEDVVLMPTTLPIWSVVSITGARSVSAKYLQLVDSATQRKADTALFFSNEAQLEDRKEIVVRYGVTAVVLPLTDPDLRLGLQALLGPPMVLEAEGLMVFRAAK